MKKRFWSFVLCLVVGLTFVKPELQAYEEKYRSAEEVFPEEEVQKLREEIAQEWGIDLKEESENELMSYGRWRPRQIRNFPPYKFPKERGVILVTDDAYRDLIPTGHAGMVCGGGYVVEAIAEGVSVKPDFLWWAYKKRIFGVKVRGRSDDQNRKAVEWCCSQTGKPYYFNYNNTSQRRAFYCSHLIYAAYKDLYGIDLNTRVFGQAIHPLELVKNDKTERVYYISD